MSVVSSQTVRNVLAQAGFKGAALETMLAIAIGESGLNWSILGDQSLTNSTWGPSYGLFQIRTLKGETGSGGMRDISWLSKSLLNQAKAAYSISSGGTNFNPWTVYKTGAYRQHLGANIAGGDAAVAAGGGMFDMGFGGFDAGSAADKAKSLYGYLGWFIDHPEVGPIILRAAEQGWDAARLQGALVNTRWWRTTSESARQFDALLQMDPATAARRITETATSIKLTAQKLGIGLSSNQLFKMSAQANRFGWNPQEIQLAIAAQMRYSPLAGATGGLGTITRDVTKLAADYLIPLTGKQAWQWARRIVGGASTIEAVESQMQLAAAVKFPHLVKDIQRGVTPGQFFAAHRNVIAETLEMSPESIDLLNGKQWAPVTHFRDPRTRKTRAMTITEAARYARSRPEWAKTTNAWQSVTEAGDAILQIFGEVAR